MSTIVRTQRTLFEKVMFAISVGLFALLNLIPGLIAGSPYADAQHGGGGGGGACTCCPGGTKICCTRTTRVCNSSGCWDETYYCYRD